MNLAVRKGSGLAIYSPQGLGGFWGKIGKWAAGAVKAIGKKVENFARTWLPFGDELGDLIAKGTDWLVQSIQNYANSLNGPADGEVTPAEEAILNDWMYYFQPYVEQLILEINSALGLPTANSQVVALNAVLNKVNALNAYYLVDAKQGLSQTAVEQRSFVVYQALDPIVKAVQMSIMSLGVDVDIVEIEFNINTYDFSPLFVTTIVTTVKGENYKVRSKGIPGKVNTPTTIKPGGSVIQFPVNTKPGGIKTNPVTTPVKTPVTTPVKTPVTTPQPPVKTPATTPVATNPATPTNPVKTGVPVTPPPTTSPVTNPAITPRPNTSGNTKEDTENTGGKKKSNGLLWLGGLLLVVGVAAAAKRKKKQPQKGTKKST